jgi:hypothetical protein
VKAVVCHGDRPEDLLAGLNRRRQWILRVLEHHFPLVSGAPPTLRGSAVNATWPVAVALRRRAMTWKGDQARVWMLTNDRPPFEEYEVDCGREGTRWFRTNGSGGFGNRTPQEVLQRAAQLGHLA